jgi:hypothetical protein
VVGRLGGGVVHELVLRVQLVIRDVVRGEEYLVRRGARQHYQDKAVPVLREKMVDVEGT